MLILSLFLLSAVRSDCSQLLSGYYVCVAVSDTPAASNMMAAAVAAGDLALAAPTPTQSGIASDCKFL
jgi:hypothetical protein